MKIYDLEIYEVDGNSRQLAWQCFDLNDIDNDRVIYEVKACYGQDKDVKIIKRHTHETIILTCENKKLWINAVSKNVYGKDYL